MICFRITSTHKKKYIKHDNFHLYVERKMLDAHNYVQKHVDKDMWWVLIGMSPLHLHQQIQLKLTTSLATSLCTKIMYTIMCS